jgi:hypothetical protein
LSAIHHARIVPEHGKCRARLPWHPQRTLHGKRALSRMARLRADTPRRGGISMTRVARVLACVLALSLAGCVVYEPMPIAQPTLQQRFDRSWDAAVGAMADQGVTVTAQDRGAGVIRGARGTVVVTASVQTLADGRIQVRFNSTGEGEGGIAQRVHDSYERRMGR